MAAARPSLRIALAALLLASGFALRLIPSAGFGGIGFDESLYRRYVLLIDRLGLGALPDICDAYVEELRQPGAMMKLPPTRFLYIFTGWTWKRAFYGDAPPVDLKAEPGRAHEDPALASLHQVAAVFSCLFLLLCGGLAFRMFGGDRALAVLAIVAFSPIPLHMAQHALVDGFYAFWATLALGLLWENLRRPGSLPLLAAFSATLALNVVAKENSFFVVTALAALAGLAAFVPKFGFPRPSPGLAVAFVVGPLAGLAVLINVAGGLPEFAALYKVMVEANLRLPYAIATGDGPWFRYLIDLVIANPLVLLLAVGGAFVAMPASRELRFLFAFVALTYAMMCNVRYAMNLRYTTIWELPLAALAAGGVAAIAGGAGRWGRAANAGIIALVAAHGLRLYQTLSVDYRLYELVTQDLLKALSVLK
jgi:4-amino-4-deoxy-L-arabinose transferase-like glycosyltransferase